MFNQDITIAHKVITNHTPTYVLYHVKGFWSSGEGVSISGTDLVKNDNTIVRILYKDNLFQVQEDDYVIKGFVSTIDTSKPGNAFKVTKVDDKDYGSLDMQHVEISGS